MPAPSYSLPVFSSDPILTSQGRLETSVNTALQGLWDDLAQNGAKYFGSRAGAVSAGQTELPATYGTIMTGEGNVVALRGANEETDDPLFGTSPFWGVLARIPIASFASARIGLMHLSGVGGTANAITAAMPVVGTIPVFGPIQADTIFGFSPTAANTAADPTVTVNGVTVTLKDVDGGTLPAGFLDNAKYYLWRVNTALEARLISSDITAAEWAALSDAVPALSADVDTLNENLMVTETENRGSVDDLSAVNPANVTGAGAGNIAISMPMDGGGVVHTLKIFAFAAGTVKVRSWTSPDNISFTLFASQDVAVTQGYGEYVVNLPYASGGFIGAQGGGVIGINSAGTPFTFYAGPTDDFDDTNGTGSNSYTFSLVADSKHLRDDIINPLIAPTGPAQLIRMVGGQGQSNMVGAPATTGVTPRQLYGAMGFANTGTSLQALTVADTGNGGTSEWPGMGFAQALREGLMFAGGPSPTNSLEGIIVGHSAKGGTSIADLGPGSAEYNGNIAQIGAAAAHADGLGATLEYNGSLLAQGENDIVVGTAEATYRETFKSLAANHDADARAALGSFATNKPYPLFAIQTTSGLPYANTPANAWEIPRAQLDASDQSPFIQIVAPMYMAPFVQDNHVSGAGSRLLGAYYARAVLHWIKTGTAYSPLRAVQWWIEGNDIVIKYSRAGLILDATWQVPQQSFEGFVVYGGQGSPRSDVTVSASGNEVRLTIGATPNPGWRWTYGESAATGLGVYTGGAGNLRDSAGDNDVFDGISLHNAALMQGGVL